MIGVLGGTFDPVHNGHLRLALEVLETLALDEVRLMLSARPPHRVPPVASVPDRRAVLEAAVGGTPGLVVDLRELDRPGPSYTVDTLTSLRREFGDRPLALVLGLDAFASIHTWHRWRDLVELAHLVVARRPGGELPLDGPAGDLLRAREVPGPESLRAGAAGSVLVLDVPALDISASRIRALLAEGRNPRYLIPDEGLGQILQRGLYVAKS